MIEIAGYEPATARRSWLARILRNFGVLRHRPLTLQSGSSFVQRKRRQALRDPSDNSPAEIAQEILQGSPYHAIRRLECRYRDGTLVVSGSVPSFFLKQLAQSAVRRVDGVKEIDYQIEVVS
jgi:osmotically-inducible protein OsmY